MNDPVRAIRDIRDILSEFSTCWPDGRVEIFDHQYLDEEAWPRLAHVLGPWGPDSNGDRSPHEPVEDT